MTAAMLAEDPTTISKANGQWVLNLGGSCKGEVWREPPIALDRLLVGLFTAQPEDVLSWVHHAVWELRTKELLGEPLEQYTHGEFHPVRELHINELHLDFASTAVATDEYHDDPVPDDMPMHMGLQEIEAVNVVAEQDLDSAEHDDAHCQRTSVSDLPVHSPPQGSRLSVSSIESGEVVLVDQCDASSSISSHVAPKELPAYNSSSRGSHQRKSLTDLSAGSFIMATLSSRRNSTRNSQHKSGRGSVQWREGGDSYQSGIWSDNSCGEAEEGENSHTAGNKDFDEYFGVNRQLTQRSSITNVNSEDIGVVAEGTYQPCAMSPVGRLRMSWDLVFCLCLAFDMWSTPFELVYVPNDDDLPRWVQVLSRVTIIIFCIDIVMNFFTGYFQDGSFIFERRLIALAYLRTWFWFDLLVALPALMRIAFGDAFGVVSIFHSFTVDKLIKALRLLRAFRMARSHNLATKLDRCLGFRPQPLAFAAHMVCWIVAVAFLVHFNASLWAACQPESWEAQTNDEAFDRYLESFSLGFQAMVIGDGMPSNTDLQRVVNIAVCMERLTFFVLLWRWCLWRTLLLQKEAEQVTMHKQAFAYLEHHKVSCAVQERVSQTLNESGKVKQLVQNFTVVARDSFPSQLRRTIRCELWCKKLQTLDLMRHPASWNSRFLRELAMTVREEVVARGVIVFTAGEKATIAFKILQGVLSTANDECDLRVIRELPDYTAGMWVGEKALLNPELQEIHNIACKVWSHLMCVEGEKFFALLAQFELKDRFEELLKTFLWHGLCGRCGRLGDHFSMACHFSATMSAASANYEEPMPLLRKGTDSLLTRSITRQASMDFEAEDSEYGRGSMAMMSSTLSMPMTHALSRLQLERIAPLLEKHVIHNVEDITSESLQRLRDDEDADLTEEEWKRLNVEDLQEFVRSIQKKTSQVLGGQTKSAHYIFISHYKMESGTEAALMKEDLVRLIQEDANLAGYHNSSAVFLDTEELRDLKQLKKHVRDSQNLLLLLTPNVLTRPWCLLEIIVAWKAGVQVVPVEVQRAGLSFAYPDEAYYEAVLQGVQLDSGASKDILAEGFTMEDLVAALRQVFMRIALPFSPHKTANIRSAELKDILKNCSGRTVGRIKSDLVSWVSTGNSRQT